MAEWNTRSLLRWGWNNRVSVSPSNILQRVHQWAHIRVKQHLAPTPTSMYHVCNSGQFYPNPTWMIPLRFAGDGCRTDDLQMESHDEPPRLQDGKNILNGFFNTTTERGKVSSKNETFQSSRNCSWALWRGARNPSGLYGDHVNVAIDGDGGAVYGVWVELQHAWRY